MSDGSEGRYALVVATGQYGDPKLQLLRAPAADAERLADVLGDPARGDFDVQVLVDNDHARLTRAIASFFRDRRPQDLLLLHFSCHGVKDDRGELYLAATDTEVDLLSATGVSAGWLSEQINRSRSRRTVVLLDCCFSGSFPFGVRARGRAVDAPEQLQGRGRVIITASNAMEYAYEGDELQGEGQPSIFTGAIVEGLETGNADLDGDRLVSVDDLYNYVYDRVKDATPSQTPIKKSELEGPLYLARSTYRPDTGSSPLDADLLARTEDRYGGIREGAVNELSRLLSSRDPKVVAAARAALLSMTDDDSQSVSRRARAALAEPAPVVPAKTERRWRRLVLIPAAVVAVAAAAVLAVVLPGGGDGEGTGGRPAAIPSGNLTPNPSFERDTSGWVSNHAGIAAEPADDAPDGASVVRVTRSEAGEDYAVDDSPETVESSVQARSYSAVAWVKATESTDGKPVCLAIREKLTDGTTVRAKYAGVTATTSEYTPVRVHHTATADGNLIGIHVFREGSDLQEGEAFLADAITLTADSQSPASPPCPT